MATKRLSTETIMRGLLAECIAQEGEDVSENFIEDWIGIGISDADFLYSDEFENTHLMIFPYEGGTWACHFEKNDGAGYNDFFGINSTYKNPPFKRTEDGSWEFNHSLVECSEFTCYEVREVTKTITVWEPIDPDDLKDL